MAVRVIALLVVLGVAQGAFGQVLIDQTKFLTDPNATFDNPRFQSYANLTLDSCYIKDVSLKSGRAANYTDVLDVYTTGRFAFRFNATSQSVSSTKRIIGPFVDRIFNETWYKAYATYYNGNDNSTFLSAWINRTIENVDVKGWTTSEATRTTALKTLIMTVPVYYAFHEIDAGFNGFKNNNATTGALGEITDAYFVLNGPKTTGCSIPVFFNRAGRTLCTVKNRRSIHLESIEAAFGELIKATAIGNSSEGIAAYEAGRQSMFKAVTLSTFQMMILSTQKALKAKTVDEYRQWVTEARVFFLLVEPFVAEKSPRTVSRLLSLYKPTATPNKKLLANFKAAVSFYLAAVKTPWRNVQAC